MRLDQHCTHNCPCSGKIAPHPGQRGGSAKSTSGLTREPNNCTADLVDADIVRHKREMAEASNVPEIFDRKARQLRLARAACLGLENSFFGQQIAAELSERLADVTRVFSDVLFIGPIAAFARIILPPGFDGQVTVAAPAAITAGTIACEEDLLPFAPDSFDLVISGGNLDSVNDLPGALIRIRQVLRPDGLFLGTLFGAGSLSALKSAMLAADGDRVSARIHPQIDVRAAGDLLMRAGFALPVTDNHPIDVRYSTIMTLIHDIRDWGAANSLSSRQPLQGRASVTAALARWQDMADSDGKVCERINLLQISGWAPGPDQPKPARRGSATRSLADVLKPSGRTGGKPAI